MPTRCIHCAMPLEVDGVNWDGTACGTLCQVCWEAESDREWWLAMGAEPKPAGDFVVTEEP